MTSRTCIAVELIRPQLMFLSEDFGEKLEVLTQMSNILQKVQDFGEFFKISLKT